MRPFFVIYLMQQYLSQIALVVKDYDEAIDFYINKLGFELVEDTF
jgi:catechol 2,3-dioxygenase-like lactoylglutathione lyase family enzyme